MSFRVLLGFLPWILFYLLPLHSIKELKLGITICLFLTIIVTYKDLQRKFILPWVTLIFFALVFIFVVVLDVKFLTLYMGILVNVALTGLALGSLAVGKPFTIQYARLEVPKEKWSHPVFIFINQVLTFVWGISFLFNLGVNVVNRLYPMSNFVLSLFLHTSTLGALIFTMWFPQWYRKKYY